MRIGTGRSDVVVIGGGLSGLAAAAYLGRAGLSVELVERAQSLGGRAATVRDDGYSLNRGAHALYRKSDGVAVLKELGVPFPGRPAPTRGSKALKAGALYQLPVDTLSLFTTGLFGLGAKTSGAAWLAKLPHLRPAEVAGRSVREWLDASLPVEARPFAEAIVRVSTYANAPDEFSAGTALLQVQRALHGVIYVDGGWQTLVDGLAERAKNAGVTITTGARLESLTRDETGHYVSTLADGRALVSSGVVLAVSPKDAARFVEGLGGKVPASFENCTQIRAATLDVALTGLPKQYEGFILGIDRPLYLSVHSRVAKLAPEGAALVHVMKYLAADDDDPDADRRELESLLELGVPGWRAHTAHVQYLPRMVAAERLDLAREDGAAGRPAVEIPGLPNVTVAGDWVQGGAWIADASLGSARAAARTLAERLSPTRAVA